MPKTPSRFPKLFVNRMFDDMDWAAKRGVLALYRATRDLSGLTTRQGETLKHLSLPALVVWGQGDKYVPARFAEISKGDTSTRRSTPSKGARSLADDRRAGPRP